MRGLNYTHCRDICPLMWGDSYPAIKFGERRFTGRLSNSLFCPAEMVQEEYLKKKRLAFSDFKYGAFQKK